MTKVANTSYALGYILLAGVALICLALNLVVLNKGFNRASKGISNPT